MQDYNIVFATKPSLRRAHFYAVVYAGMLAFGRLKLPGEFESIFYGLFGVLLALLALVNLRRYCTDYIITDQELVVRSGILMRSTVMIPFSQMRNFYLRQPPLERVLGLTSLYVTSSGDSKDAVFFRILNRDGAQAMQLLRQGRAKFTDPTSAAVPQNTAHAVGQ